MLTQEQIAAAHKANLETFFGLTNKAFEGVEKLVELNLQVVKATKGSGLQPPPVRNRFGHANRIQQGCRIANRRKQPQAASAGRQRVEERPGWFGIGCCSGEVGSVGRQQRVRLGPKGHQASCGTG
jgi:hypothetical protein